MRLGNKPQFLTPPDFTSGPSGTSGPGFASGLSGTSGQGFTDGLSGTSGYGFASGPSVTSGQGAWSTYDDCVDRQSHVESPIAAASGDMAVESAPHFDEVHVDTTMSSNDPPKEKPKGEFALLAGLQALGSVMGSAIDSFSMVRPSLAQP